MIDVALIEQLFAGIVAVITTIIAIIKAMQEKKAVDAAVFAQEQVAAYDPASNESKDPAIVSTLPPRSYLMSDSTRRWLTFDATPANIIKINQQIDAAEAEHLTQYQIVFDGGYYNIEYGLLKGGAGNPSGK